MSPKIKTAGFKNLQRMIPVGTAAGVVLLALVLSSGLFQLIPAPALPPVGSKLQASPLHGRLRLFHVMMDAVEGQARERWVMRSAEGSGLGEGQEIKPFDSVVEFGERLW
ncbi:MAG TPA: hypothetical protein VI702_05830, partial [Nitrospiria bacterium]